MTTRPIYFPSPVSSTLKEKWESPISTPLKVMQLMVVVLYINSLHWTTLQSLSMSASNLSYRPSSCQAVILFHSSSCSTILDQEILGKNRSFWYVLSRYTAMSKEPVTRAPALGSQSTGRVLLGAIGALTGCGTNFFHSRSSTQSISKGRPL